MLQDSNKECPFFHCIQVPLQTVLFLPIYYHQNKDSTYQHFQVVVSQPTSCSVLSQYML